MTPDIYHNNITTLHEVLDLLHKAKTSVSKRSNMIHNGKSLLESIDKLIVECDITVKKEYQFLDESIVEQRISSYKYD